MKNNENSNDDWTEPMPGPRDYRLPEPPQPHPPIHLNATPTGPVSVTPANMQPVWNPNTGAVIPAPVVYAINPYKNTTCIVAMILGLATFLTFGFTGIPAVIVGFVGLGQCKAGKANQQGMAITGIALGGLAVVGWCLWWLLLIIGASSGSTS